jgi:hypothetical protein
MAHLPSIVSKQHFAWRETHPPDRYSTISGSGDLAGGVPPSPFRT